MVENRAFHSEVSPREAKSVAQHAVGIKSDSDVRTIYDMGEIGMVTIFHDDLYDLNKSQLLLLMEYAPGPVARMRFRKALPPGPIRRAVPWVGTFVAGAVSWGVADFLIG